MASGSRLGRLCGVATTTAGCALVLALSGTTAWAADATTSATSTPPATAIVAAPPTIEAFVKSRDLTRKDGFFTVYTSAQTGQAYLAVRADQLGKEFLYFAHIESGDAETGQYRGRVLSNFILKFRRPEGVQGQLELDAVDTSTYFDPASPLARSANANIPNLAVAAPRIEAQEGGVLLIAADAFRGKLFEHAGPQGTPTGFAEVRNFPANTDFLVDYPAPTGIVRVQHSLIEMAPSDYAPRTDDFRVGYFTESRDDLTTTASPPYRDLIHRWNLRKKEPSAALSEPVKPIVFWIENTAPVEFRPTITKAVLSWNKAFEAAGFKNAIEVRQQPDNPTWHAGDVHYNVIRWVSSPDLPYVAETPHVSNPRTGEILNATVIVDYTSIAKLTNLEDLYAPAAAAPAATKTAQADLPGLFPSTTPVLQHGLMLGMATLEAQGAPQREVTRLVNEYIAQICVHEVGHALGLTHNFRGSTLRALSDLQQTDIEKSPLTGSVMDYLPVNLAHGGQPQGPYYQGIPGPYDIWAIQFGYTPPLADPQAEAARVKALLTRSTEPQLAFANDADYRANRWPDPGIDPRAAAFDLSSDPVAWASDRLALLNETTATLRARFVRTGQSYQSLQDAFYRLLGERVRAAQTLSRYIGGVYVERALLGQPNAKPPLTPVPRATQKAAMAALAKYVFGPDAFAVPADLARDLMAQPRGIGPYSIGVVTRDPPLHDQVVNIQSLILSQLLAPSALQRLTDSEVYGGAYGVDEALSDLTAAIFAADAGDEINSFRRDLQTAYVERLASAFSLQGTAQRVVSSGGAGGILYGATARGAIFAQLQAISAMTAPRLFFQKSAATEAHRAYLHHLIDNALRPDAD